MCWLSSCALIRCTSACLSICPCPPVCVHVSACIALPNYPLGTTKTDWSELCRLHMTDQLSFARVMTLSLYANLATLAAVSLPACWPVRLWFGQNVRIPPAASCCFARVSLFQFLFQPVDVFRLSGHVFIYISNILWETRVGISSGLVHRRFYFVCMFSLQAIWENDQKPGLLFPILNTFFFFGW